MTEKENERENESRFWKAKNHAERAWVATEETPVWAGVGMGHAALGRKGTHWRQKLVRKQRQFEPGGSG